MLYNYRLYQRQVAVRQQIYVRVASAVLLLGTMLALIVWGPGLTSAIQLLPSIGIVLLCVLGAYALACVVTALLLLLQKLAVIRAILYPVLNVAQSIPSFILLLVLVIYPGAGDIMIIPILGFVMLWPLFFTIADGASRNADSDLTQIARSLGARGWRGIIHYYVPALRKYMVLGSIVAWTEAWNIIIGFEIITNAFGVGAQLAKFIQYNTLETLCLWAALYTLLIFLGDQLVWIPLLRRYGHGEV